MVLVSTTSRRLLTWSAPALLLVAFVGIPSAAKADPDEPDESDQAVGEDRLSVQDLPALPLQAGPDDPDDTDDDGICSW